MDTFFENADESLLRWRMSVEEEESNMVDDEDGTAEPVLKAVVRTSYLHYLRRSLRKNLESSKQKNVCDIEENMINKVIKGCSALLEEKALRSCMIARLYQRFMAQTIKEVKKATNEGQLYAPLKEFSNLQSQVPATTFCDKEIQTDDIIFPNPPSNLSQQVTPDECDKIPDAFVKRDVAAHFTEKMKYSRLINGISNADNWKLRRKDLISNTCGEQSALPSISRNANDENRVRSENVNFNGVEQTKKNIKQGGHVSSLPQLQNIGVGMKQETDTSSDLTVSSAYNKNDAFQIKLRSSNFVESVAYWYSLECELEELPPLKRQKLDEKFSQLFGKDHGIDYYFLTDEQKSITCRKRIAKHVVMELTNYYNKKKIASKQLFKTMAKHITSILLGHSLFPNPEEIRRSVEEFFVDDRIINSEDDFFV